MDKNTTYFVTGATGFIGGRLIELLALKGDVQIHTLVRNYSNAARIARFDVKLIKGSLLDNDIIDAAVKDCDVIFHCAYDPTNQEENLQGIQTLISSCIKYDKKLIHISTFSVYEPYKDGVLDERIECFPSGNVYADSKLQIEKYVLNQIDKGNLRAVILQPTIVYGPYSSAWTLGPLKQLLSGTVVLPDKGEGLCNAVYVDDVCNAMLLAAKSEESLGEKFLISGPGPITWIDFFQSYAQMLGVDSISLLPRIEIQRAMKNPLSNLKLLISDPKRIILWSPTRKLAFFVKDHISIRMKKILERVFSYYQRLPLKPVYLPDKYKLNLFSTKSSVSVDKAGKLLKYKPSFDIEKGFKLTESFIKWYLPPYREIDDNNDSY